jgi:hypothetical protein
MWRKRARSELTQGPLETSARFKVGPVRLRALEPFHNLEDHGANPICTEPLSSSGVRFCVSYVSFICLLLRHRRLPSIDARDMASSLHCRLTTTILSLGWAPPRCCHSLRHRRLSSQLWGALSWTLRGHEPMPQLPSLAPSMAPPQQASQAIACVCLFAPMMLSRLPWCHLVSWRAVSQPL